MAEFPFYMNVKLMSRSRGHNAVAAAAYRSGQRLAEVSDDPNISQKFNEAEQEDDPENGKSNSVAYDYRRRHGVMSSFISAPSKAPQWAKDRGMLWNAVERAEKRVDAQLAREVVVSLPDVNIFDHLRPENKEKRLKQFYEGILKSYVNDNFVKEGMIADVALHTPSDKNDDRHFHAHIMLTTRSIDADGFGKKERGWNNPKVLEGWRQSYAKVVNDTLKSHGVDGFIDHRTYEERGLDIEPTKPLGSYNHKLERFGVKTEVGNDNRKVKEENLKGHKYLEKVFEKSPIAPEHEILNAIEKAGFSEPHEVKLQLEKEGALKRLSSAETGHVSDMFSFTPMVERLNKIKDKSERLHNRNDFNLPQDIIDNAVKPRGDKLVRDALQYVSSAEGFKVVETENTGHKSTMMSSVREMYKQAGYDVVAVARNNQGKEAFAEAGFTKGVMTYRDLLRRFGERYTGAKSDTKKVILVDDADNLSPLQDQEIFNTAQKINAKLIYIGNKKAKKKKIWQSLFSFYKKLTEAKRLREKFFKAGRETAAIRDAFTQSRTLEALKKQKAGYLHVGASAAAAKRSLIDDWFAKMRKKDDRRFILTASDKDVGLFNTEIQKERLSRKHLKETHGKMFSVSYKSDKGGTLKRDLNVYWGDMIQFKKNYHDLGIEEGSRARVMVHQHGKSVLELDDGRRVDVDLREANGFDLGYAGRMVSQTGKLDHGYLHHSKANATDDAPLLYQHSENPVRLFTDKKLAPDLESLSSQLLGRGHDFYEGFEDASSDEEFEEDIIHGNDDDNDVSTLE